MLSYDGKSATSKSKQKFGLSTTVLTRDGLKVPL